MLILKKMLVLFLLMMVGFYAWRKDMLDDNACKKLSGFIVYIANPAIIISSGIDSSGMDMNLRGILWIMAVSWVVYAFLIVCGELVPRLLRIPKEKRGTWRLMTVFTNMGYMGFPLLRSVYGSTAVMYASLFLIPFNVLLYTYGIAVMRSDTGQRAPFRLKNIINSGTVACLIMLIVLLLPFSLPEVITDVVSNIAATVVPLSMMIIGTTLAKTNIRELFLNKQMLVFSLIKLFVIPLAGIAVTKLLIHDEILLGVILIVMATPIGSTTSMVAQEYNGDYMLTSRGVVLTTILSVVTIPVVFSLAAL
ncbi:MAG: AEC family transporter [Clostridiales bacterium]|nr:AEC family transporter [Clostridiales bacterium]